MRKSRKFSVIKTVISKEITDVSVNPECDEIYLKFHASGGYDAIYHVVPYYKNGTEKLIGYRIQSVSGFGHVTTSLVNEVVMFKDIKELSNNQVKFSTRTFGYCIDWLFIYLLGFDDSYFNVITIEDYLQYRNKFITLEF
jgi:hypothetical protein